MSDLIVHLCVAAPHAEIFARAGSRRHPRLPALVRRPETRWPTLAQTASPPPLSPARLSRTGKSRLSRARASRASASGNSRRTVRGRASRGTDGSGSTRARAVPATCHTVRAQSVPDHSVPRGFSRTCVRLAPPCMCRKFGKRCILARRTSHELAHVSESVCKEWAIASVARRLRVGSRTSFAMHSLRGRNEDARDAPRLVSDS
jgi:hypothetical protein